jgi:hypothetical protein
VVAMSRVCDGIRRVEPGYWIVRGNEFTGWSAQEGTRRNRRGKIHQARGYGGTGLIATDDKRSTRSNTQKLSET